MYKKHLMIAILILFNVFLSLQIMQFDKPYVLLSGDTYIDGKMVSITGKYDEVGFSGYKHIFSENGELLKRTITKTKLLHVNEYGQVYSEVMKKSSDGIRISNQFPSRINIGSIELIDDNLFLYVPRKVNRNDVDFTFLFYNFDA